jgi:hypothetical protein
MLGWDIHCGRKRMNKFPVSAFALLVASFSGPMQAAAAATENEVPICKPPPPILLTRPTQKPVETSHQEIYVNCGSNSLSNVQHIDALPKEGDRKAVEPERITPTILLRGIARYLGQNIWPLLVLFFLVIYRKEIGRLIDRTNSVSWDKNKLMIDTQIRSQTREAESAKVEQDVQESIDAEGETAPDQINEHAPIPSEPPLPLRNTTRSKYLEAEDLALRALQSEYGVPIRRQVTAGADSGFDGYFVANGQSYIVEVKYYKTTFLADKLAASLTSIANAILRYEWRNVQIVLVAVFEELDDPVRKTRALQSATASIGIPVAIRCYSMKYLRGRYQNVE